jgi:putative tryptophan/tyrosine transport system substrate-binding protein
MRTRREFLIAGPAGLCVLASPRSLRAQQANKIWRIGFFYNGSRESAIRTGRYPAFLDGMHKLGYVQGKDFVVEERFVADIERLPALALGLVRSNVDIVVSTGGPSAQALKQATTTVPVIFAVTTNPVREGLAASFARPGGNFTGTSAFLGDVFGSCYSGPTR